MCREGSPPQRSNSMQDEQGPSSRIAAAVDDGRGVAIPAMTTMEGGDDDENEHENEKREEGEKRGGVDGREWPEDSVRSKCFPVRVYQRWTYSYMSAILRKGSRQTFDDGTHLVQDDLFSVPHTMESRTLAEKFWKQYEGIVTATATRKNQQRKLIVALWRMAIPTFVPAGFCQLVTVLMQVAMPLLVRQLLTVLEENPKEKVVREGLPYAVAVFGALVVNAFANHRHRCASYRSTCTSALY